MHGGTDVINGDLYWLELDEYIIFRIASDKNFSPYVLRHRKLGHIQDRMKKLMKEWMLPRLCKSYENCIECAKEKLIKTKSMRSIHS